MHRRKPPQWLARRHAAALVLILGIGAALRLWDLGTRPDWQSDEPVYTAIARYVLFNDRLQEHLQRGEPWTPFLYHPPFYFLLLASWFRLVGPGIAQARDLAAIASVLTLALLFVLIWRLRGTGAALMTLVLVTFDGWLLFVERVSYIENTLLVLVVGGLLLYERALRRRTTAAYAVAGAVLGSAVVFKQTATYVLPAVALHWLIVRRDNRYHWYLAAAAGTVIAAYLGGMIWLFDYGKHRWFLQQSLIQVERVLGFRQSRGTLNSPLQALYLLAHQYSLFLPSFLIALAAVVLVIYRTTQCIRTRSWEPVRANSLLFSWCIAAILVFGPSQLHFPQYFALILIPLYCFLWTELYEYVRTRRARLRPSIAVLLLVILANLGSFYLRVVAHSDNTLWQIQQYANTHIPRNDTVITEEEIADEIRQPWCSVARAGACRLSATYVITYGSYLQPIAPPGDTAFWQIIKGARKVKVFVGFKATITVWKLQ